MKNIYTLSEAIELMATYIKKGWKVKEYEFFCGATFVLEDTNGSTIVINCTDH